MSALLRTSLVVVFTLAACGPVDMGTPDGGKAGGSGGGLGGTGGGTTGGGSAGGGSAAGGSAAGGSAAGGSAAGGSAAGGSAAGGSAAGGSAAGGSAAGGSAAGGSAGGGSAQVSFMTQISPILVARCGVCHALTNSTDANTFVRGNAVRIACSGQGAIITAGNATGSLLFKKITGTQTCGSRMPLLCTPNVDCLPQNQIDLIRDWINAGAPNN